MRHSKATIDFCLVFLLLLASICPHFRTQSCSKFYCESHIVFLFCFSKGALTVGLPPAWVDVSEEIAANVQRARTKMAELAKAHAKALMPSFGDGKEDQHLIEALTQEITTLIKRSEKKLQRLSAAGPSEDSNVRKNVQV